MLLQLQGPNRAGLARRDRDGNPGSGGRDGLRLGGCRQECAKEERQPGPEQMGWNGPLIGHGSPRRGGSGDETAGCLGQVLCQSGLGASSWGTRGWERGTGGWWPVTPQLLAPSS